MLALFQKEHLHTATMFPNTVRESSWRYTWTVGSHAFLVEGHMIRELKYSRVGDVAPN